ncbi:MAG: CatB-related O-acetyltransferase [Tissierellaceae bacterium]|nr:CatB-related O-acetyltransferase [Tissierellaceae bacterium]
MRLKQYLPQFLKDYILLIKAKIKYRECEIYSPYIHNQAKLGLRVKILKNVIVYKTSDIGDYSYVNSNSVIGIAKIGKFCSIGYNCQIGVEAHPTNFISTSPYLYGDDNIFRQKGIYNELHTASIIGNDCWIGSNAVIMQGVTIGDGAIIGAGSVVTKDVQPYSIVGGVPAKFIRYRFDKEERDYLLSSKWWELEEKSLIENKDIFLEGKNWIKHRSIREWEKQ